MNPYDTLHLVMFSGKGGVGKTTLSCAFARHWARQFPNQRILLISTDPAHSLGDVLQMDVEDQPHSVLDLSNLQIRALDAGTLLQRFRARYGEVLELLVERGSFVEGKDLSPIWDLGFPGLDELMAILEIQRILREQEADRIVVDMAPSGHTLNLFGLMDFLDRFLQALELFQKKHHTIHQSLTGRYVADEADAFLAEMQADLLAGRQLLQDPTRSACLVVAIAEPMSYLESHRFLQALEQLGIPFGGLWINRLKRNRPEAPLSQEEGAETEEQQEWLGKFWWLASSQPMFAVPLQDQEPVGLAALDQLLAESKPVWAEDITQAAHLLLPLPMPAKILPSFSDFMAEGRRLLLVGGKGGVGKTTVSAAIAWAMAERHSDCKIRVISIDPAHSLGDAFGLSLGHQPISLTSNLTAQEVDAKQVLEQFRADYLWDLAEMMSGSTGDDALQLAYAPEAWRLIVSQALPGIDEMLSLLTVIDLLEQDEQDLILLDTAPTGHLLRFLEMPHALADWLGWIFKLWIKYQDVVGGTDLMGRLRILRQRVVQAQKKLRDPNYTEFVSVLQSQSAIVAETERLARSLHEMGVNQRYLVHNRYHSAQRLWGEQFPDYTIVRLPELPRGIAPLTQIQEAARLLF